MNRRRKLLTVLAGGGGAADAIAPTVVITSSESSPTTASPIPITITFSEEVSGFVVGDLTVGNGSAGNFATADNIVFTADITPDFTASVTVDINAAVCQDLAGNDNEAATQFSIAVVLISDLFTDADGTSLDAHTPNVNRPGNAWVKLLTTDADIQIQSNRAQGVHTGVPSYPAAIGLIDSGVADILLTANISTGGVSSVEGLVVRGTDINNCWIVYVDDNNNFLILAQRQAGVLTTRASIEIPTLANNTTYAIHITCVGNTITATLDGANQIQYASATFQNTATKHGVLFRRNGDWADTWVCSTNPLDGGGLTLPVSNIVESTFTPVADDWNGRASVEVVSDIVVLTYQVSSAHAQNDGNLHIRFSDDYGETWSDEDKTLAGVAVTGFPMKPPDCSANEDAGEPWLYIAPNGNLILHMWRADYGVTANGTYQSVSTDGGLTWSTPAAIDFTGIADDTKVFATDDHFIYDGVIYAGARLYDDAVPTNCKNIFIKSTDNGATWDYVSDISNFTIDTVETGIEYLGDNNIICILRTLNTDKTYKSTSSDMGATWSALTDISDVFQVSGRHRIWTQTHLQGGESWWTDSTLIVCGFVFDSGISKRRNSVWLSRDKGATWNGPYWLDLPDSDGGYGDMFYDPNTGKYVFISYRGSLAAASLKQYKFSLDFP